MRILFRVLVLLLVVFCGSPLVRSQTPTKLPPKPKLDLADRVAFMAGDYTIVGRKPDSTATYTGKLTFRAHDQKLDFTRTVGGRTVHGTAVFDTVAGGDKIPVLRMTFSQFGRSYAGTYQWSSDYDNYCRFTGYVYLPDGSNKAAGLEALFPVPPSVKDCGVRHKADGGHRSPASLAP